MVLESIKFFLFEQDLTAIHYVIIAVIGSLVVVILTKLLTAIWKVIKTAFNLVLKFKCEINRRYIKNEVNLGEYKNIRERLKNGGQLKWHEKRGYKLMEEHIEKPFKVNPLHPLQIYKPIYRDYVGGGDHDKTDA